MKPRRGSFAGRALTVAAVLVAFGCDSDAGSAKVTVDREAAIRAGCAKIARAWCDSSKLCLPALFATAYGSDETCLARRGALCERTQFGEGATLKPEQLADCAAASAASDCAAWLRQELARKPRPECSTVGTLAEGARCMVSGQCEVGTSCGLKKACGRCLRTRSGKDTCFDDSECAAGRACRSSSCVPYGDPGAECGPAKPCNPDLACAQGGDGKRCEIRRGHDQPCDPAGDECALWPEQLACSPLRKVCERYVFAKLDAACGELDDGSGSVALCEHGLWCKTGEDPRKGKCVETLKDRWPCAAFARAKQPHPLGGPCRAPAVCHDVQCQILDSAACSAGSPP